jgi:hypothetical protein
MGNRRYAGMRAVRQIEEGKMTVEASFLLPMVLFVIVILLFFFFYEFESGVAAGILCEEVSQAADVVKTDGKLETGEYDLAYLNERKLSYLLNYDTGAVETQLRSAIKEKLARHVIFGNQAKVWVEIKHGEIQGKVTSQMELPVIGAVEIGGFSLFKIEEQISAKVRMPAEQIRRWQQIE